MDILKLCIHLFIVFELILFTACAPNDKPKNQANNSLEIQPVTGTTYAVGSCLYISERWEKFKKTQQVSDFIKFYNCIPSPGIFDADTNETSGVFLDSIRSFQDHIYKDYSMLREKIVAGDSFYLESSMRLLPIMLASYSEELYYFIGESVKNHPELFLEVLQHHKTNVVVSHFFNDWGSELNANDKYTRKWYNELNLRYAALVSVNNSEVAMLKEECLAILSKEIENVKNDVDQ